MMKFPGLMLLPFLALGGCGLLTDITLGAETLPAYQVDRSWRLQAIDLGAGCPVGRHQVMDELTGEVRTLEVAQLQGACGLTFLEPDAVLFDEAAARSASDALGGGRIEAVQAAAVEVSGFSLTDGRGMDVDVGTVSSVRMSLADALVLDRAGLDRLQAGETVRAELPQSLLDRILQGFSRSEAVRADVAVVLEVPEEALAELPESLRLRMRLQPEVTVDVVEYVGG